MESPMLLYVVLLWEFHHGKNSHGKTLGIPTNFTFLLFPTIFTEVSMQVGIS